MNLKVVEKILSLSKHIDLSRCNMAGTSDILQKLGGTSEIISEMKNVADVKDLENPTPVSNPTLTHSHQPQMGMGKALEEILTDTKQSSLDFPD